MARKVSTNVEAGHGALAKPRKSKPPVAPTGLDELYRVRDAKKSLHMRSARTDKAYNGHLNRGHSFLAALVSGSAENRGMTLGDHEIDLEKLSKAFSNPPNEYSALALELFLVQKCLTEDLGKDTASGIHAAFIRHWDHM
jgi:hypothetical protein